MNSSMGSLAVRQEEVKRPRRLLVRPVHPPQLSGQATHLLNRTHTCTGEVFKRWRSVRRLHGCSRVEAPTLSDMRSVMLRSTQSLRPVDRASAKRSLAIAFMTRLAYFVTKRNYRLSSFEAGHHNVMHTSSSESVIAVINRRRIVVSEED
ncbi:hypothetical protein EYF80_043099 [Liparis tanakae]|uniref:Uncharacterized protein n=1 Tax=Liparis tanakae TaxID=230148 RepID=A0A4Z2G0A7_9TELE|nr:hypothetical protein EYF80_043099 [Liparis tanakae]